MSEHSERNDMSEHSERNDMSEQGERYGMSELKSVTYTFTSFDELPREGSKIIWHKQSIFNLKIVRVTYYDEWTKEEGIFFNNEKITKYELKNTYWAYLEQVL